MNILIPDSWLREYLRTKATPKQIAESLSLCSQSVERIIKEGNDFIYEIEITNNRPDCLAVYGIARELAVILPRFGIPAKLKELKGEKLKINSRNKFPLKVKITNESLCPRFTALVFDEVKMAPSPKIVQERLKKCGIRALNNVVDISNYLMLEIGQPMHTFDYDKIGDARMILREAKEGEEIITLDNQKRVLPKGAIVIEDGRKRLIDLCGIMGGENSAVDQNTKRVLLFIQTYDPMRIRRACQNLSFWTEAALRFEKGIDPEGVMLAMEKAAEMFQTNCQAKIASDLVDIYPHPPKTKTIKLELALIEKIIGVKISRNEAKNILKSLGFSLIASGPSALTFSVPHWRNGDISIPEDLVEEVARLYGYHKIPDALPFGLLQTTEETPFFWQDKIKNCLKYLGFSEIVSYSLISENLLKNVGLDPKNCLKVSNPLSLDWVFLRPTLIPSLLEALAKNQDNFPEARLFELANVYLPQDRENLPREIPMLTAGQTGDKFLELKGVLEALLDDLGIRDYKFAPLSLTHKNEVFNPAKSAQIFIGGAPIGILGEIKMSVFRSFGITSKVVVFDIEFNSLIRYSSKIKRYTPIPLYPPIIEDLAFVTPEKVLLEDLVQLIKSSSSIIQSVKLLDIHENTKTLRIFYQHPTKTLSDKEIKAIREKIIERAKKELGVRIKGL